MDEVTSTKKKKVLQEDIKIIEVIKFCNGCGRQLPQNLDKGICPHCLVKN